MSNRLASLDVLKGFLFGADTIKPSSGEETELKRTLERATSEIEHFIYSGPGSSLKQQQYIEFYGPRSVGGYGSSARNVIRLRHRLNLASVDEVDNDGTVLTANDDYFVDDNLGTINLLGTRKFTNKPGAVKVTYTSGYAETGSGDAQALAVPVDLEGFVLELAAIKWRNRKPGAATFGAIAITSADGVSLTLETGQFTKAVREGLNRWKATQGLF